jgi:hypothetical protein
LLSNAIADVFRALDNVDTAVELNTPISMGMFDSIIKRIEKYEEGVRFSKSAATVDKSKSWNQLKAMDIFSDEGVNVRRAPKTKKTLSTLVILYSHRRCWFDTCRRILMTAEESKILLTAISLLQIWQWLLICTKVG